MLQKLSQTIIANCELFYVDFSTTMGTRFSREAVVLRSGDFYTPLNLIATKSPDVPLSRLSGVRLSSDGENERLCRRERIIIRLCRRQSSSRSLRQTRFSWSATLKLHWLWLVVHVVRRAAQQVHVKVETLQQSHQTRSTQNTRWKPKAHNTPITSWAANLLQHTACRTTCYRTIHNKLKWRSLNLKPSSDRTEWIGQHSCCSSVTENDFTIVDELTIAHHCLPCFLPTISVFCVHLQC